MLNLPLVLSIENDESLKPKARSFLAAKNGNVLDSMWSICPFYFKKMPVEKHIFHKKRYLSRKRRLAMAFIMATV